MKHTIRDSAKFGATREIAHFESEFYILKLNLNVLSKKPADETFL